MEPVERESDLIHFFTRPFWKLYFQFVSLFNFIQNAFLSTHCEKRQIIIEALKNANLFLKGLIFEKALYFS